MKLTQEDMRKIAAKEEARDTVRKIYPKLSTKDVDLVVSMNKVTKPQNWKTFAIDATIEISGTPAKVVGLAPKDIILNFAPADPPVKVKDVVKINGHDFRVREVKGLLVAIRPLLGTTRQYV